MGVSKLTVTNLEVIEVNKAKNSLLVKGSIPGARGGFLILEKTGKAKGYTPPPEEKKKDEEETQEVKIQDEKQDDKEQKSATTEDNEKKTEGTGSQQESAVTNITEK